MGLLENMQNSQPQAHQLLDEAFEVLNASELSFADKLSHVQKLEKQAEGIETELFGDVYSSLSLMAKSPADRKLIAGA